MLVVSTVLKTKLPDSIANENLLNVLYSNINEISEF